jgi:hypothetical protein
MLPLHVRVKAKLADRVRIRNKRETGTNPVSLFLNYFFFSYLPRKNDITAPSIPTRARPRITKPIGILGPEVVECSKFRVAMGGGGVKVGNLVAVV